MVVNSPLTDFNSKSTHRSQNMSTDSEQTLNSELDMMKDKLWCILSISEIKKLSRDFREENFCISTGKELKAFPKRAYYFSGNYR